MLTIATLGQLSLSVAGVPIQSFRSQKEVALLLYLGYTGQTHNRETLAELFWTGRTTKQSLANLRTVLARLRKQVPGDELLISRKTVALVPEIHQQLDSVVLLRDLGQVGDLDSVAKATRLHDALKAYRGEFATDFYIEGAPGFNDWVAITREHIQRQVATGCQKLTHFGLAHGEYGLGLAAAERWIEIDRLDEAAQMQMVRLLVANGRSYEAIAHYERFAARLESELGVAPQEKLTALVAEIRPKAVQKSRTVASIPHNLLGVHDEFVGRVAAQADIHERLDRAWCRLVTLVGHGGVGKTRLAMTVARNRLVRHPDGVWLVELADIDPDDPDLAEAIATEVATALDLRLAGQTPPNEQLIAHLKHKEMLLVLDNFEHVLGGVPLVLDIIQQVPTVQILATSREPLGLRAEWTIDLAGLDFAAGDGQRLSAALALFQARYAQWRRGAVVDKELAAMGRICQLVEGVPLAIELAAALTRRTVVERVADLLQDGFAALESSLRDMPQRHRSLQVVFATSWQMLTVELKLQLARLSIFRGGFSLAAAQKIAGTAVSHLDELRNKSLLTWNSETERYRIHAVVRQFAAEKRPLADPTPHHHATFYLDFLAQHAEPLQKGAPQLSVAEIEPEIDNVRLAWQTGLVEQMGEALQTAVDPLSSYYQLRGLSHEAEGVMKTAVHAATGWETAGIPLAARAAVERARFQIRLGRYPQAIQTVKTAVRFAKQCGDEWAAGMAHILWGEALWRQGEYALAEVNLHHAFKIAKHINSTLLIGWCHHHFGIIYDIRSDYTNALHHLKLACTSWESIHHDQALIASINSLGLVNYHCANLKEAQQMLEASLILCQRLDNRHSQPMLLNTLSMVATELTDYTTARGYLKNALALAQESGNISSQGNIYSNLGRNDYLAGWYQSAEAYLEKGLHLFEQIGDRALAAQTMLILAETIREKGELKRAETLHSQSLEIASKIGARVTEFKNLIGLATLLSNSNSTRAAQYVANAVALANEIQNSDLLQQACEAGEILAMSNARNEKSLP